jgi:hypothetical protein
MLRKKVDALRTDTGVPDEAAIALAIYEADAYQSLCGPATAAKLKAGSRINGWVLNEKAVEKFQATGQGEIDVTPKIIITVLSKDAFKGRLKPTAINVLLNKYRFDIPPNSDTLAYEPKTGTTVVAYSQDLQDVAVGNLTRSFYAGGILRIFVGKTHIYLIEFQTNTSGISGSVWDGYQKYLDSFTYVGEK